MLGLPFALVHGRAFVAWRHLEGDVLELAVQDVDPILMVSTHTHTRTHTHTHAHTHTHTVFRFLAAKESSRPAKADI